MGDEFDESSDVSSDIDVADTADYSSDESYDTSDDSAYEIPEDTSIDEDVEAFDDTQAEEFTEDIEEISEVEDSLGDEYAEEITEDTGEAEIEDVSGDEYAEEIEEDTEEIAEEYTSSDEYAEEINEDVEDASELNDSQTDDSIEEINEDTEESIEAEAEETDEYDDEIVEDTELSEEINVEIEDATSEEDSDVNFTEEVEETTDEVTEENSDETEDATAEESADVTSTEETDETSDEMTEGSGAEAEDDSTEDNSDETAAEEVKETTDEVTEENSDETEDATAEESADVTSAEETNETSDEMTEGSSAEVEDDSTEDNSDETATEEVEETTDEVTEENSDETEDTTAEESEDVTSIEETNETSDEMTEGSGAEVEDDSTEDNLDETATEEVKDTTDESAEYTTAGEESDIASVEENDESASEVVDTSEETEDGDSSAKVLKRNEYELLQSGNDAINQRLEAQADDYRDKGYSEEEIADKLAADKWRFQQEFLDEAFPGQDVSPNVFNGFSENGAKDRIAEINSSDELKEILQSANGEQNMTESYDSSYGDDVAPEETKEIGGELIDITQDEMVSDAEQVIEAEADYEKAGDQSDATNKLAQYMNENNYNKENFSEYSQDPQWRELQESAFGEFALQDETVERPMMRQVENQESGALNDVSLSRDVTTNSDATSDSQDIARKTEYLEKLKDYCEQQGYVGKADFSDFDPHVAYDLAKSVVDAKNDFPDLEVGYLGSISHQVEGIKKNIYDNQYNYYKSTGFSDEIASAIATQDAEDTIKSYGMNDTDGTYAWSFKSGVDIVDEYAGVAMNDQYAKDYDSFIASKQNDVLQKWAPVGCGTPKAVTDHELGHEIDKLLDASSDFEIREMYSEMMKAGNARDVLSQYSATNVQEFIAESYSEFRNNPSPRDLSTRVYNRLIELRDQKIYRKGLVR